MGSMRISVTAPQRAGNFENVHLRDGQAAAAYLSNMLTSMAAGSEKGTLELETGTALAKATGTFTLASVIATDVVLINGVTLTCVASGATANQFNVGGTDTITATNMAAAINASTSALVSEHVTASAAAAVVTITAKEFGDEGNAITISSPDSTITASGARLSGGDDALVTTYSFG